ncbi:MAG: hypothetical protein A4E72_01888 [Syntrophus sp. PtaU1.Bin208]|nr:MAG: hypothetical protein A4E72_01888 [Syntrophus sp. PtaU1.Bin208]
MPLYEAFILDLTKGRKRIIDFSHLGRLLILFGLLLAAIGFILLLAGKVPWLGRLPGDFYFRGKQITFFFPLTTSLLISLILTLILWWISRR